MMSKKNLSVEVVSGIVVVNREKMRWYWHQVCYDGPAFFRSMN